MSRRDGTKPRPPMKALPPTTPQDSAHNSSTHPSSAEITEGTVSVSSSREDGVKDGGGWRESGDSIKEDISHSSSVPEEVLSDASQKMRYVMLTLKILLLDIA